MRKKTMYKVTFRDPPLDDGRKEFYFSRLTDIYLVFTKEAIGCDVGNLWNAGVSKGNRYTSRTCTVERTELVIGGNA